MSRETPYPSYSDVSSDIGDKVLIAMQKAVEDARRDLALYRQTFPQWVADATSRGLANWIHDRMWASLAAELSDVPGIGIVDNGVLRELTCGTRYRFRAKRHDEDGHVQSYPTQQVLEFHYQPATLETLEEFKLDFGYEWDSEAGDIGPAVMSLRHGSSVVFHEIISSDAAGAALPHATTAPVATSPKIGIDVRSADQRAKEAGER